MIAFPWRWLPVVCCLAALGAGGWALHEQRRTAAGLRFLRERLRILEAENARLREALTARQRAETAASDARQRQRLETIVADLRQLPFRQPVIYDVVTRHGIRAALEQKIAQQYTDTELAHLADGYAALGLLPAGYPLKQKLLDLLGEQVAAFYDESTHRLFMFEDAHLDSAQHRVVLVHELVHALQDQHFSLNKLPLTARNNDDLATATSALVEGDAMLVMSEYLAEHFSADFIAESFGTLFTQNMEELRNAPRYLRETLLFAYVQGRAFCEQLVAAGGLKALDRAYASPPTSTAQVLHPELYLARPRVEPVRVEWAERTVRGREPFFDNVLGELGTRVLLAEWGLEERAADLAAGWRGDRVLVFDDGPAWVWQTVWRSPAAAGQFAAAVTAALERRRSARPGCVTNVLRPTPEIVTLIEAATDQWATALAERFAGSH